MTLPKQHSMRTELGKARGLGSAHHGSHHWWAQRLSAIGLVPLCLWFLWGVFGIQHLSHGGDIHAVIQSAHYFIGTPINTILAMLLVIALFYHIQLGLQVIIEDYIHTTASKLFMQITLKFGCLALALGCLVSILSITFN